MKNIILTRFLHNVIVFWLLSILLSLMFLSCNRSNKRAGLPPPDLPQQEQNRIGKVTFFIENSESMFGYVRGLTDYVNVVSELAEKPEFAQENTLLDFNFINGGNILNITSLGSNPTSLNRRLNVNGFRCGNITQSNLNGMFEVALNKARGDSISILISDGIYDIGNPSEHLQQLAIQSTGTRSMFIKRLSDGQGNLQTLMIKLNSSFNGEYFYSSQNGSLWITNERPYYIWIFGESQLLNKYFPEKYITENLEGFVSMLRYFITDKVNLPYQVTTNNLVGFFMFDKFNRNKLLKAKLDKFSHNLQFDIAVDYSSLPLPESYLSLPANYSCSGAFQVKDIKPITSVVYGVSFKPTHMITLFTNSTPYGILEINLKNVIPAWINETHAEDETNIRQDTSHTFGFKYLTDGISSAYQYISGGKDIGTLKVEILRKRK